MAYLKKIANYPPSNQRENGLYFFQGHFFFYVKVLPWPTNLNNIVHTTTTNSEPLSGNIIDCVPCIVKGGKQKYVNQELNTRDCMFSKVMVILQQAANLFEKYERKRKQLSYLKTIFFH